MALANQSPRKANHLSFWSFSLYNNCPASYKLMVLDHALDGIAVNKRNAVEGAVGHTMLEVFYKYNIENPAWLTKNVPMFFEKFSTENLIEWRGITEEEKNLDRDTSLIQTQAMMVNMVGIIEKYDLIPAECKPEFSFTVDINETTEYAGRMDMWMRTKIGECLLLDWKFTKKKSNPDPRQLKGYKMACDKKGMRVDKVGFVYPWFGEIVWKTIEEIEYDDYVAELEATMEGINKKIFHYTPARYKCNMCDCRVICQPYKLMKAREEAAVAGLKIGENEI